MLKKHVHSFKNAYAGLKWVITTQSNFRIHVFLSFLSIVGGFFFHVSYEEFLIIVVLICVGLVIEIVNTAIEETIDALDKNPREEIRIAKDVSASAMLVFSIGSFLIASIIFIPKIIQYLNFNF
ncbi:MAG: diacylglycerol kinase family protein [bacterium]|nr:diacylglycerol kinase family protein [bacterium]